MEQAARGSRFLTKLLAAGAILLLGPLLGIFLAFVAGALVLPPDPNLEAHGMHAAPGDGFLIVLLIFASLVIFVPSSLGGALVVLLRKPKRHEESAGQLQKTATT